MVTYLESYNTEYKEDMPKPQSMKAEIVSFLNSNSGGTILLGVDDNGQPITFDSEEKRLQVYKNWEETLMNWVATAFRPEITGLVMIEPNEIPFKVTISADVNKPYYYTDGEGLNSKGVYIREGSSKRRASDAEIRRMMNRHIANSFDGESSKFSKLNFKSAQSVFEDLSLEFNEIALNFRKNNNEHYNNAGLIVSDQNPFISKLAVYSGTDTLSFKDKQKFEGSIVRQIDDALNYLRLINNNEITFGGNGRRIESFSYPQDAIREALMNAFIHRDYTMTSDIKIEIYNNRIEISSPGSLPDGLTIEDIKRGTNVKRNPILINALDKMDYIENYGSGIRRIYSLYKSFEKQPELIATHNLFTVILYNKNYKLNQIPSNTKLKEIVEYLADGKLASRLEIQEAMGLQKSYTAELIAELKKADIITSEGRGPGTKYYLKND